MFCTQWSDEIDVLCGFLPPARTTLLSFTNCFKNHHMEKTTYIILIWPCFKNIWAMPYKKAYRKGNLSVSFLLRCHPVELLNNSRCEKAVSVSAHTFVPWETRSNHRRSYFWRAFSSIPAATEAVLFYSTLSLTPLPSRCNKTGAFLSSSENWLARWSLAQLGAWKFASLRHIRCSRRYWSSFNTGGR